MIERVRTCAVCFQPCFEHEAFKLRVPAARDGVTWLHQTCWDKRIEVPKEDPLLSIPPAPVVETHNPIFADALLAIVLLVIAAGCLIWLLNR